MFAESLHFLEASRLPLARIYKSLAMVDDDDDDDDIELLGKYADKRSLF